MILLRFFISATLILITSCDNSSTSDSASQNNQVSITLHEINGRDHQPLYRMRAPKSWIQRDPIPNESLTDTTKAICEFIIRESDEMIRIAIHNFPSETLQERIPPEQQIFRWKNQFELLIPESSTIIPQAFSGYSGFLFEGTGILKGKSIMMLSWALQVAPEHYQTLVHYSQIPNEKSMRADVTIKAVGPLPLMKKYREAIIAMGRSFELIEEIPNRS